MKMDKNNKKKKTAKMNDSEMPNGMLPRVHPQGMLT